MSLVDAAIDYVYSLFRDNAGGHDAAHTLRVYQNAMLIAEQEPNCDLETVAFSALLHDADDHKLFNTENHANARCFLREHGIEDKTIRTICEIIGAVSFSQNRGKTPATLEGKIVQDADRLDALGAVGIARTFAYGGKAGRSLDDSLRHFHEKLLLLKDEMSTDAAKQIAVLRHRYMEEFLLEYDRETEA